MNQDNLKNLLQSLKNVINRMNSSIIEMISIYAAAELMLRKSASAADIESLEKKILQLINQYSNFKENQK
jgi:intracellular sulfur oxidation DsrE/DsrF family protein